MKYIFVGLYLFIKLSCFAQTPFSVNRILDEVDQVEKGISLYNPYGSISFTSVNIDGIEDLSDNFKPAISLNQELLKPGRGKFVNWRVPLGGNFTLPNIKIDSIIGSVNKLKELSQSRTGLSIGLYPYYILDKKSDQDDTFYAVAHFEASLRYNSIKNDMNNERSSVVVPRYTAGIEIGLKGLFNKKLYNTISLTLNHVSLSDNKELDEFTNELPGDTSLGLAGIIPFSERFMMGYELIFPFNHKRIIGLGIYHSIFTKDKEINQSGNEN